MHFNQLNETATTQIQLNQHLDQQADQVAPEGPQKIRNGMWSVVKEAAEDFLNMSKSLVEQAFQMGQSLLRMKTDLKRDEYKVFLTQIGWTSTKASKYIKLAVTFEGFAIAHLQRIELTTLFTLCRSTYSTLVEQLRNMGEVAQGELDELMKAARPAKKPPASEPMSGWKRMPSGGGRYYNLILHNEEAGVSIEQQAAARQVLPQQIIIEAITLYAQHEASKANQVLFEIDSQKLKQSQSWEEIETIIGRNSIKINKILKQWSLEERQRLIPLLARYLLQNPRHRIEDLFWVPQGLLLKALSTAGLLHPKYFAV